MRENEQEFSFKNFFTPLTTLKAIHIIIVVGIIVFFNVFFNNFVWDDTIQIVNGNATHSLFNILSFFVNNNFLTGPFYRPIQLTYIAFFYTFFGQNAFVYHLLQVALHITNSILIFYLFKKIINKNLSLFLALVFLVHPIVVESVAYVSASSEVLFTFFGLLALLLIEKKELTPKRIAIIYLLLLLSILAKESGFLFLIMVFLYKFLIKRRIPKIDFYYSIALIGFYLFLRIFVAHIAYKNFPFIPITTASVSERLITMPKIVLYYLKTFLFPNDLAISQQWLVNTITFTNFVIPLLLIVLLLIAFFSVGLWIYKNRTSIFPFFLFFTSWFFIGLAVCLQIIPLTMTVADRWFYFPLIGLLGMIGITLQEIKIKTNWKKIGGFFLAIILIIALSVRTVVRNANWYDSFTLYSHDESVSKSLFLESDLGVEYMNRGEYDKAILHFKRSVATLPFEVNLFNLGLTYAKENNNEAAHEYFHQAVEQYKGYEDYTVLARLLFIYHDTEDAKLLIEKGLMSKPNDMQLLMYLGLAEYKLGNKQKALEIAQKAYSLYPNDQTQYMLYRITNNLSLDLK